MAPRRLWYDEGMKPIEKPIYAVVDRIEEGKAVVDFDEGGRILLDVGRLPPGTAEGTVLRLSFEADPEERRRRLAEVGDLQRELRERTARRRGEKK